MIRLLSGGGGIGGGGVCGVRLVQPWQSLSSFVLYPVVQKGSWVPLIGQLRSHGSHLRPHPHPLVWSHPTHFRPRLVTQKACLSATMSSMKYPSPRRDASVVEEHFGIKVADPYRWMEDPDSQETKDFVDQQNAVSQPFIESCSEREEIKRELTKLWNYPKYGVPHRHGKKYYFSKNNGIQNQSVMYTQDSLSGQNYPEVLTKIKFSPLTWTHDSKGIFYGYYPDHVTGADGRDTASHDNQKLYYHRIGTPQSEDVLCVDFPEHPKWRVEGEVSDCGRYLLVCPGVDCQDNLVFFADLEALPNGITGKISLTQIIFKFEADYQYVTNTGSKFVFRSNKNAPRYQLICIDLEHPEEKNWSILIPEHESNILEWATCVDQDKLVVCYMEDVKSILKTHDLNSGAVLHEFPLGVGSIVGVSGEKKHSELFYKFSSMITPGIIYFVDMSTKNPVPKVFIKTEIEGLDESKCEVKQVFYPSKDGTKIPMFIAHRKDEKLDGNSPCLLYGYGGFNVSLTPSFSISQLFFIQHFGVLAIPNIRGGGEYGRTWHDGGRLLNKQNVFDDFVAAAEFLVQNKYTRKEKLTIKGGSNGGLLVGACLNQRPDLFGAGVAAVGVMDMIRFHKFTIGHAWCSDFGNPETEEHFKYLLTYSPLHNIRVPEGDVQYPCVLLTTADHDDRVVPSHSLKFIAELQQTLREVQKQTNPLLIRVETKAGHGGGKPTSKSIEEITDVLCFLVKTLGYEFK
ncbi:prolyl endopeptidase-like [Tigriopus californicus]|uniref:prolyl endopeptidase-like n=1 Tax=Tigriopus californicus TaxID=6832 RepID=UPI0027DA674A|nr:prolyl endopeptidase-like [Tigriopus californicus]